MNATSTRWSKHVSHDVLDFMKAQGINGLMSEEGFESFHPSIYAIHREQKASLMGQK
jgi:hypothetical protein